jgi:hypothetical protein
METGSVILEDGALAGCIPTQPRGRGIEIIQKLLSSYRHRLDLKPCTKVSLDVSVQVWVVDDASRPLDTSSLRCSSTSTWACGRESEGYT